MIRTGLSFIRITGFLILLMPVLGYTNARADTDTKKTVIPFKKEQSNDGRFAIKVVGSLILVSLLGVATIYALKRYMPIGFQIDKDKTRRLRLVESLRVSPKTTLILVEFDGEPVLLAQSTDRIAKMASLAKTQADKSAEEA